MNELKYTTPEMLNKYEVLWKTIRRKHGDNLDKALAEIIELEKAEITSFNAMVDEDIRLSKQKQYKSKSESMEILLEADMEKNQQKCELSQAAFFRAISAYDMAKQAHMGHLLHDTRIIFGSIIDKLKNELEIQQKSQNDGSVGGDVFAKKSEQAVFLALDLWRKYDYKHSMRRTSSLIKDKINLKISELNIEMSECKATTNTAISLVSEISIYKWISALKHHIDKTPKSNDPRKCIKFYYENYFLKNIFYF